MAGLVVTLFVDVFASSPSATRRAHRKSILPPTEERAMKPEARGSVRFATNVNINIANAAGLFVMRVNVIDDGWGKGSDFFLL